MQPTVTHFQLSFQGYSLHVTKITTKAQGKSAVYLHGMCMHGAFYHGLTELLPEDFAQFYFIDMPHHGRSSGPKGFLPSRKVLVDSLAFALDSIRERDGLPGWDLISAESMGGVFALYYLLKRDRDPQCRYLLFGAPLHPNWGFFFTDLKQPLTSLCTLFDRNRMVLPVKDLLGDMTHNKQVYEQIRADGLVPEFANMNYLLTIQGMSMAINAGLGSVSNEILLFYGQEDAISNWKKTQRQHGNMPNLRTIVVPHERHSMFWADKETYRAQIEDWLSA